MAEGILNDVLRGRVSSNNRNDGRLKLSREEAEKFKKAFSDESFRTLLAQYASDFISDPQHRKEQEDYLRDLESRNCIPEGKLIIRPQPGFVLKFKLKETSNANAPPPQKESNVLVNVVHSDQISQPTSEESNQFVKEQGGHQIGRQWSLPYSIGPMRKEKDEGESLVTTFDCAFHPDALLYASKAAAFKDLVIDTAREGAEHQLQAMGDKNVEIDASYHILRDVAYKNGTPPVMVTGDTTLAAPTCPREGKLTARSTDAEPSIIEKRSKAVGVLKKGFLLKKATKPSAARGTMSVSDIQGPETPRCRLVEQGTFEISDHTTLDNGGNNSRRPKGLILYIDLPRLETSKEVKLDVTKKGLVLQSTPDSATNYFLSTKFPYSVRCDDGRAKFDSDKRVLTVRVPVSEM